MTCAQPWNVRASVSYDSLFEIILPPRSTRINGMHYDWTMAVAALFGGCWWSSQLLVDHPSQKIVGSHLVGGAQQRNQWPPGSEEEVELPAPEVLLGWHAEGCRRIVSQLWVSCAKSFPRLPPCSNVSAYGWGPCLLSYRNEYNNVAIDYFLNWQGAFPIPKQEATTTAKVQVNQFSAAGCTYRASFWPRQKFTVDSPCRKLIAAGHGVD